MSTAETLLQVDAESPRKIEEYKQLGFLKFSDRFGSQLSLIRLLANPEIKTYEDAHACCPGVFPLKNITLVIQWKDNVLVDFWFTHMDRTQAHCKNNFDVYNGVPTITTFARGMIIYDRDIEQLLRTGFVHQTSKIGSTVRIENHYIVTKEMLANIFLKQ
ncbi:MAG: hypothetical protein Terrestrivirus6_58 [Terrestrivirus sp.]|jgi:hypothetical protein|uniref:Uncharacterized protein n=1 Tax=Terrestrivirus sp. TaxID=2487775 RepID=A0A3G4ZNH6_9VIRU|nr:MAG: hypothetical protein Terrestrivirus6_58 [Terrestrivirus sp.]